ncbi:unnamed protein product [Closterium sp. Naga37s-1]|nr:unnamed protein product [Closterium sp. Naga37s-1]
MNRVKAGRKKAEGGARSLIPCIVFLISAACVILVISYTGANIATKPSSAQPGAKNPRGGGESADVMEEGGGEGDEGGEISFVKGGVGAAPFLPDFDLSRPVEHGPKGKRLSKEEQEYVSAEAEYQMRLARRNELTGGKRPEPPFPRWKPGKIKEVFLTPTYPCKRAERLGGVGADGEGGKYTSEISARVPVPPRPRPCPASPPPLFPLAPAHVPPRPCLSPLLTVGVQYSETERGRQATHPHASDLPTPVRVPTPLLPLAPIPVPLRPVSVPTFASGVGSEGETSFEQAVREGLRTKAFTFDPCHAPFIPFPPLQRWHVGSAGETSFEQAVRERLRTKAFTFDPFLDDQQAAALRAKHLLRYIPIGLGAGKQLSALRRGAPGKRFATLAQLMGKLNHSHIDVLKIDCERCEERLMEDLLNTFGKENPPAEQILVEIHQIRHVARTTQVLFPLEDMGYRLFNAEANPRCLIWFAVDLLPRLT